MYLRSHVEPFGLIRLSLNSLMAECGYSTKTHNKNAYDDFRNIIHNEVILKHYASSEVSIHEVAPSTYIELQLSQRKSIFFTQDQFVHITIYEFERIVGMESKVNKSVLFGVFMYVKQFIIADSLNTELCSKISFPSKKKMRKALGVSSSSTIESALAALVNEGLLYVAQQFYIEDEDDPGNYIPTRNVYALNESELIDERIIIELENFYKTKIFKKNEVNGNITFLKEKE